MNRIARNILFLTLLATVLSWSEVSPLSKLDPALRFRLDQMAVSLRKASGETIGVCVPGMNLPARSGEASTTPPR